MACFGHLETPGGSESHSICWYVPLSRPDGGPRTALVVAASRAVGGPRNTFGDPQAFWFLCKWLEDLDRRLENP